jgi:hypothetical protein
MLALFGHLERMHEERTTKKITRWTLLSSRPKGRPKKNGKKMLYDTRPSNREDQELEDVRTKEGAI